jgi:hypothetical protein
LLVEISETPGYRAVGIDKAAVYVGGEGYTQEVNM